MKHSLLLQIEIAIWTIVATSQTTLANNNRFLPGDAFFPTVLTAEKLNRLKAAPDDPPIFEYSSFDGYEDAFCGYAGYNRATVPGLDEAFISNLKKVYADIREYQDRQLVERKENGKLTLVETNGVRVLFYPQAFKFPEYRIGLRYNEKWVEETVKFGHQRQNIRLCSLIPRKDAIMESWRDATAVGSLDVSLPQVELKPVPVTNDPIIINGNVKAIVLDSPLLEYFNAKGELSLSTVRVVDSSGITEIYFENGEWITAKEAK